MILRGAMVFFLAVLTHGQAWAEGLDTTGLKACGTVTATGAISGARFTASDGTTVKLALVKAPELWEKGQPYKSWPYAAQSRAALLEAVQNQTLALYCEGAETNHHGEVVAHVILPGGRWLQRDLVAAGHVFVFPRPTRRRGLDLLFAAETGARAKAVGLWAFDNLKTVDAAGDQVQTGWFQIVSGVVRNAQKVGPTVFLNFGDDWRTDFTVEIPAPALRHFAKAGIDPLTFGEQTVEVRGWVDWKSGPRILLQGPGQIRLGTDAGQ